MSTHSLEERVTDIEAALKAHMRGHHQKETACKVDESKRVTVYTFDANAKVDKYHFYGMPYFERIERENIVEGGKVAVIVEGHGVPSRRIRFTRPEIDIDMWVTRGYGCKIMKGWYCGEGNLDDIITELKTAILKKCQNQNIMMESLAIWKFLNRVEKSMTIFCFPIQKKKESQN